MKRRNAFVPRRKRAASFAALAAALAAGFVLLGWASAKSARPEAVMFVDGTAIAAEELRLHMDLNRAMIADYVHRTYGASDGPSFWTTPHAGEVPLRKLLEAAADGVLRQKIVQRFAREAGAAGDIGHEALLDGWRRENERRSQAASEGEAVYGPLRFDLNAYFGYYMANLENAVMADWREHGRIAVSDAEIRREYEANRQTRYMRRGDIEVDWVSVAAAPVRGEEAPSAADRLDRFVSAVAGGESFSAAAEAQGLQTRHVRLRGASYRSDALEMPIARQIAQKLKKGEISEAFEENGALHVLRCVDRTEDAAMPLASVRDAIVRKLERERYERLVDRAVKEAATEWDEDAAMALAEEWLRR